MFKKFIQKRLEHYVRLYFARHPEVKLVAVAGSLGKTSSKVAIATVLAERYRVRLHQGNHNTHFSAPLAILGIDYPGKVRSVFAWLSVLKAAAERVKSPADVDVIVQELGVDRVGDMAKFGRYLQPDIAVVTAVTSEHMEYFKTMDAVAREELLVTGFSRSAVINRDDIDGKYAELLTNPNIATYGTSGAAEYGFINQNFTLSGGHSGLLTLPEYPDGIPATIRVLGEHNIRPALAAVAVGARLGLTPEQLVLGLEKIRPVPGRMNVLRGLKSSIIIDDTYNSSPLAAASALQTLYAMQAPQRIAVFGGMNELGETSAEEHAKLGAMCDMNMLAWVVTVGEEAEKHLAPAARSQGCQVRSFRTALEAGAFVNKVLETDAVVLFKGSQGGIFLEEAVKMVLLDSEDNQQLVRQTPEWTARKDAFFSKFA